MKTIEKNFRGHSIEVLWINKSGSDLATIQTDHFTGLHIEAIRPLLECEEMTDDEVDDYLRHCMIDNKHPYPSSEALLHAFLPFAHIDHTHPEAIMSLCCADNGQQCAKDIYGDHSIWIPAIRSRFTLAKLIAEEVKKHPAAEVILLEKQGLLTWGNTSEASYHRTIATINAAQDYREAQASTRRKTPFAGAQYQTLPQTERHEVLLQVLPTIRGMVSEDQHMIVTYDDSEEVLSFVNCFDAPRLSQLGMACPDGLEHTKHLPLYVQWEPSISNVPQLLEQLKESIDEFSMAYHAYFERNKADHHTIKRTSPHVILIPGIGMINTGESWFISQMSSAFYRHTIAVIQSTTVIGSFNSLSEAEAYDREYSNQERNKAHSQQQKAEFSGQVGLITGGAGGIGSATCRRLVAEGMQVVIADINLEEAQKVAREINQQYGEGRAIAIKMDVTSEQAVQESFHAAILTYGGIDVLVNNAGLATSNPLDETTLEEWSLNSNVLSTGYFLVAREAFALLKKQRLGGNMIFVGSKNAVYAGKNVAAYSAAKAAEIHLARCIAVEGGSYGIRVNTVLPDAVLQGTALWNSRWKNQRAATYGIEPDQLEAYYRKRTILQVNVFPEDVAEGIAFLASSRAAKTTGCMLNIDGGIAASFVR